MKLRTQGQQEKEDERCPPEERLTPCREQRGHRQGQRHVADGDRPLAHRRDLVAGPGEAVGAKQRVQAVWNDEIDGAGAELVQIERRANHEPKLRRLADHGDQPGAEQNGKNQAGDERRRSSRRQCYVPGRAGNLGVAEARPGSKS